MSTATKKTVKTKKNKKTKLIILCKNDKDIRKVNPHYDLHVVNGAYNKLSVTTAPEASAIVVVIRSTSGKAVDSARKLSLHRDIPLILAFTGNYILPELEKRGIKDHLQSMTESEKKEVHKIPERDSDAFSALDHEKLWSTFRDQAIELVRALFKPGESVSKEFLISELSEYLTVPKDKLDEFPGEIVLRGVLYELKDDVYALPKEDGTVPDSVSGPTYSEKEPSQGKRSSEPRDFPLLIAGLPKGPYPRNVDLEKEASKYKEFLKDDGTGGSRVRYYHFVRKAIELGIVKKTPEGLVVEHDSSVELTLLSNPPTVYTGYRKKKDKKPQNENKDSFRKTKKKDGTVFDQIPTMDAVPISVMAYVRPYVSDSEWDDHAVRGLESFNVRGKAESIKGYFSKEEWDEFAWHGIRKLPIELFVQFLGKKS